MPTVHRVVSVTIGTLLLTASLFSVAAQDTVELGARVRVRTSIAQRPMLVGTVLAREGQSLGVSVTEPASLAGTRLDIALEHVTRLEVSQGRKSQTVRGALIGGGVGLVAVASICLVLLANDNVEGGYEFLVYYSVIGMAAGAATGGLVGTMIKAESWRDVSPARLRVSLGPHARDGMAMRIMVRF